MAAQINIDGGARGNPGPSAIAAVVQRDGQVILSRGEFIGHATNNVAEYKALILGLKLAHELELKEVQIRGDSKLVVEQVNRRWKIKDANLEILNGEAQLLLKDLNWDFAHVRREENKLADALVNEVLDKEMG